MAVSAARPTATAIAAAYDATGASWEYGPGRVYNHLAGVVVGRSPVAMDDRLVLDVGAGTGAASRAIERAAGFPIAVDFAVGVLAATAGDRAPAAVADACALPFADRSVDGVVAAFAINHVATPSAALAEARRVCRPGSPIVASAYAAGDDHPAKRIVEDALRAAGWAPPPWYDALRREAMPRLATPEQAASESAAAGLDADVEQLDVALPWLAAADLVAWRLGLAQHAPFVDQLAVADRDRLRRAALDALGDEPQALVRSIIVIRAVV
jgi:ubiquinone/menaquinone biosynthesis C-methylase UbiE